MRLKLTLTCLSLMSLMAACTPAGYYDSNGDYRSYGQSDLYNHNHVNANAPDRSDNTVVTAPASTTTIIYTRPGYYDYNGYYISEDSAPRISDDYFPPRGMCRVWFTDHRPYSQQPPVETCRGIQSRVPAGAYVIYGG